MWNPGTDFPPSLKHDLYLRYEHKRISIISRNTINRSQTSDDCKNISKGSTQLIGIVSVGISDLILCILWEVITIMKVIQLDIKCWIGQT